MKISAIHTIPIGGRLPNSAIVDVLVSNFYQMLFPHPDTDTDGWQVEQYHGSAILTEEGSVLGLNTYSLNDDHLPRELAGDHRDLVAELERQNATAGGMIHWEVGMSHMLIHIYDKM